MLQILIVLVAVTIDFPDPRVMIRLDKRVMMGNVVIFSEPHLHEVPSNQSMVDGLDSLADYLALNSLPNISTDDRALLLNVTNAARGVSEQRTAAE